MKKAIFWDFDGTLVYSESLWSNCLHAALCEAGLNIPFEKVRGHLRSGYSWHSPEKSYPNRTGDLWWEDLFAHMRLLLAKHAADEAAQESICALMRGRVLHSENYRLYEDAVETLEAARALGYAQYILSNNYPELPAVIADLGLGEFFAGYAVSGAIGYEKPRRELFDHACAMAGHPDIAFMVGDNPVADIEGGNAAGMTTVLVHSDAASAADYACDSLRDIVQIMRGI